MAQLRSQTLLGSAQSRIRVGVAATLWVGNPAKSATVEDMLDACKNKDGEGERKHSQAIYIEDMCKLHDNYLKNYPVTDPSCNLPDLDKPLKVEDLKK